MTWRECDHFEMHPYEVGGDKPCISTPMIETKSMLLKDWKKTHKHTMKLPVAFIDAETWSDFNKPASFGLVIVDTYGPITDGITGAKFILNKAGKRTVDEKGHFLWKEDPDNWPTLWNRCDKHLKEKNGKRMVKCDDCVKEVNKPKHIGKYWSKMDDSKARIRMTKVWCWPNEVESVMFPLLMEHGVKSVYAHNATVDIIAVLKATMPNLNHPLEHFTNKDESERARLLFAGSKILTATMDIAPFYNKTKLGGLKVGWWKSTTKTLKKGEEYQAVKYNRMTRKAELHTEYPIEFLDSFRVIPLALATIGQVVGFPKGTTPEIFMDRNHKDWGNWRAITNEMIDYNIQDCEVLFHGMQTFFEEVKALGYHSSKMPLTAGTLGSQMIAKANILECKKAKRPPLFAKKEKSWKMKAIVHDTDADDLCREAMVGGRTQVFNTDVIKGRSFGIDAKSMYPSQMTDETKTYPDFRKQKIVSKIKDMTDKVFADGEGVVYVNWKRPSHDKVGLLSHKPEKGGLDWTLTSGQRWITFAEYRKALSVGYKLKIKKDKANNGACGVVMARLTYNPFQTIKNWYDKRNEMKANNNPMEFVVKILLNAGGFGKFVERNQDKMIVEEEDCINFSDEWQYRGVAGDEYTEYGYMTHDDLQRADGTANCMGSYITAYARINLYEVGIQLGAENLLYCDTDSWKHTNSDLICPNEGTEMGEWALEQEYDYWESVAPKQYKYHAIESDGIKCDTWKARVKGCSLKNLNLKDIDLKGIISFTRVLGVKESFGMKGINVLTGMPYQAGDWILVEKDIGKTVRNAEKAKKEKIMEMKI